MGASALKMCLVCKRPVDFLLPKEIGGKYLALHSQGLHFFLFFSLL